MAVSHSEAMGLALEEARKAWALREVPVGAVVVHEGRVIGRGHNLVRTRKDPAAHAEILALQEAARRLESERLSGATVVTTLEPCAMCVGALVLARVAEVVFGADDPKAGALGSTIDLLAVAPVNHRFAVHGRVRAEECQALLQQFFVQLRP